MSWNDLRKGRFSQTSGEYFITFTTFQRQTIFTEHNAAACFCRSLSINENNTGCKWLTWVLMPDHFHGLVQLNSHVTLAEVIKDLKGRSAKSINESRQSREQCWQPVYHDRALKQDQDRKAVARYIAANPLRAGLVDKIGDYPYWNSVYL